MDQRNCIKFCVKNEIKCAKTFKILTVSFRKSTKNRTQVQLWYNRFKEGQEDVNSDARPSFKCKGFAYCFLRFAMAWYTMNSCHEVVRSIRNTNLKLCADCAKQFVRNAQNCGKTNYGFCTKITQQLTHQCLCLNFLLKTKP